MNQTKINAKVAKGMSKKAAALESSAAMIITADLAEHLRAIHPANVRAVVAILAKWASGQGAPQISKRASTLLSNMDRDRAWVDDPKRFKSVLVQYARLLMLIDSYLWPFANQREDLQYIDATEKQAEAAMLQLDRLAQNVGTRLNWEKHPKTPDLSLDPIEHGFSWWAPEWIKDKLRAREAVTSKPQREC